MTKRSPRDWGLALIRRYASLDEAAAIGISAYRDPNDPAALQTPPSEPAQSLAPRATALGSVSSSAASSSPDSSSPASSSPEPAPPSSALELLAYPARRFVAPRIVSSIAPGSGTVAPSRSAQPVQSVPPQRSTPSPAPLEQSSGALQPAPPVSALLELSRPAIVSDAAVDAPLETAMFAAPQTDAAPDSAVLDDAQFARAAITSEASPSTTQNDVTLSLEPTLEPVQLSGTTRRFLEPLVGFDPNEVSVYSGEAASRVTRDLRADAAAQDGVVLLADASNLETPAQLGLLAHELIHAAQQQSAVAPPDASLEPALESPRLFESVSRRFVPAIGSSDTRSVDTRASSAAQLSNAISDTISNTVRQSNAPLLTDISSFASEEDRARTAEARVTQIARAGPFSSVPISAEPSGPASWNGLPAPWERLPSLDAPTSDDSSNEPGVVSLIGSPQGWGSSATTTNPVGYGGSVTTSSTGFSSSASSSPTSSNAASGNAASSAAQAAEIGRELPADSAGATAAPDLEQLAKQVYDVLKRRLQSDRRRSGV